MKKTIAVVDDDRPILDVVTLILREEGYNVKQYRSGEELLRDNELEEINLFLLDYRLPKRNGVDVANYLKSDETTKNKPVIMISANHNLEKQLINTKIDDFIAKPFEVNLLMDKVNNYLQKKD